MSYYRHELENEAVEEEKEIHWSQEYSRFSSVQYNLSTLNFPVFHASSKNNSALYFSALTEDWYPAADSNHPGNNVEDI